MARPLTVFVSYSHEDEQFLRQLEAHLAGLEREGIVSVWHDRDINAGDEWEEQLLRQLNGADVILLLISPDFIASEFCWETEMTRALERHEDGDAKVIPLIVRDCDWHSLPFGKLQALPTNGKPLADYPRVDTPLAEIARAIRRFAERFRDRNGGHTGDNSRGGGTAVATSVGTRGIQLTIDKDFASFSNHDRRRLLEVIGKLLETDEDIRIHRVRRGSVKVEFQLTPDKAEKLYRAAKQGQLQAYGVVDASFPGIGHDETLFTKSADETGKVTLRPTQRRTIGLESLPALIGALKDQDLSVRERAVDALGRIVPATKEVVLALIDALKDQNLSVRQTAVDALVLLEPDAKEVVPALIDASKDQNLSVRQSAVDALVLLEPDAKEVVPALIDALNDQDPTVRQRAVDALVLLGPAATTAVPALIDALKDRDPSVRQAAVEALGRIGPAAKKTVPALIDALKDRDPSVRQAAVKILGIIGPAAKEVVLALIDALKDQNLSVRQRTVETLGRKSVPALIDALNDRDPSVRQSAVEALGRIVPATSEVVLALSDASKDRDLSIHQTAVDALKREIVRLATDEVVPALIDALKDRDLSVRQAAAAALVPLGPAAKKAVPALINALEDRDPSVRQGAVKALGIIGPAAKNAVPALIEALYDQDSSVRKVVAWSLRKIQS